MKKLILMVLMAVGLGYGDVLYNTTVDSLVFKSKNLGSEYYDIYVTRYYRVVLERKSVNDSVLVFTDNMMVKYITKPALDAYGTNPAVRYNSPFDSVTKRWVIKAGRYIIPKRDGLVCSVAVQYKLTQFDLRGGTVKGKVYFDADSMMDSGDNYWTPMLGGWWKDSFTMIIEAPVLTKAEVAPAKPLTTLNVTKTFDALGREVRGMVPRGVYFVWDGKKCVRRLNLK